MVGHVSHSLSPSHTPGTRSPSLESQYRLQPVSSFKGTVDSFRFPVQFLTHFLEKKKVRSVNLYTVFCPSKWEVHASNACNPTCLLSCAFVEGEQGLSRSAPSNVHGPELDLPLAAREAGKYLPFLPVG